jgi:hypothetical protein
MKRILTWLLVFILFGSWILTPCSTVEAASGVVTPGSDARSGLAGSVVAYNLVVTITDYSSDFTLSAGVSSVNGWTTTITPSSQTVTAAGDYSFGVNVVIPASPSVTNDSAQVNFSDGSTILATALLTTSAILPSPSATAYSRPIVVVESFSANTTYVTPGTDFTLTLNLKNNGGSRAANILISFEGQDFVPVDSGGVISVSSINAGGKVSVSQNLWPNTSLSGQPMGILGVKVAYTDSIGTSYSESFSLAVNLAYPQSMWAGAPTQTPTAIARPQLVIQSYETSVDPLQPGTMFDLTMEIENLGTSTARSVSMVLGGGVIPDSTAGGTAVPGGGGTSSGADLTNFAPLGSSNVIFIGDIPVGTKVTSTAKMIVNTNTNPGAYSFKISFTYDNTSGYRLVNDQSITLLVFSLPQVEVNFYRSPDPAFAQSPVTLPLQVTNLGRKLVVLGNMTVTSEGGSVENNTALVGILDPGGYFTLDSILIPYQEGPVDITVRISYTDDFNQPREIEQNLTVDVMPAMEIPTLEPGVNPEGVDFGPPETFFHKVMRFFRGLFGLDSAPPQPPTPVETTPEQPMPVPGPGTGGKGG